MLEEKATVKTAEGGAWEFVTFLPETLEEAESVYGPESALFLLNSGLKVKQQNVAREAFRADKTADEVNDLVRSYRPGGARTNVRERALELITDKAAEIQADPELKKAIKEAFKSNKFKDVITLLKGEVEEDVQDEQAA